MPQDILREVWDVVGEDVETDFPQDQGQLPSVDVNGRSIASRNLKDIVYWLLIFLSLVIILHII